MIAKWGRGRAFLAFGLIWGWSASASAHDIPNARVDRSIQVEIDRSGLRIDYEVSLAELTLTQDLRSLVGSLPSGDRPAWFRRYGEVTSPLNGEGFLIRVEKTAIPLQPVGFDLIVDQHPRFVFHYRASLPPTGRLSIRDTNYVASEGTSRLAIRAADGISLKADDLPADVGSIPIRPIWQLSDEEERRTKEVEVEYQIAVKTESKLPSTWVPPSTASTPAASKFSLTSLLDQPGRGTFGWILLGSMAVALGAVHSLQPGHGKTLAAAASIGSHHPWRSALILGGATTLAHLISVLAIALGLWLARGVQFGAIHRPILRSAGFGIAATGFWKLGRRLGRQRGDLAPDPVTNTTTLGLVGLGVAGGMVPCWEAIGLVVLAESVGRLSLGMFLLAGFSVGMGAVLVLVAGISSRFGLFLVRRNVRLAQGLDLLGSLVLVALGGWLLLS